MKLLSKRLPATKIKKLVIPSIGVLALIILSSFILFEATKATVHIIENGKTETVKTHANTVEELLKEYELVVEEYDWLSHKMDSDIENGMEIEYKQAEKIIVTIDNHEQVFYTTEEVIEDFLQNEGLSFSKHDDLSFDLKDEIVPGLSLDVTTAFQVTINDAGEEESVWTTGGSVGELLDHHNIVLNEELDKIDPLPDELLNEDTFITITRVEKTTVTTEENIDFKVEKKEDNSLAKGKEKVISEGKVGTLVKTFEITKENGEEVGKELINEEVKVPSENRVVAVGTKIPDPPKQKLVTLASKKEASSSEAKSSEPSSNSEEVLYMNATAFTANCNGCSGITRTGINLKANPNAKVIAVDPNVIPLGTKVWVEGYGNAVAGDTGGSIRGNKIDVHVPTRADAFEFGRKKVKVKILK